MGLFDFLDHNRETQAISSFFNKFNQTIDMATPNQDAENDPVYHYTNFLDFTRLHQENKFVQKVRSLIISKKERKVVPITSIFGINAGKSTPQNSFKEYAYNSLEISDNPRSLKFQTDKDFKNNILRLENRFRDIDPPSVLNFSWSNKQYIRTPDRTHTLSAILRQCIEQERTYNLDCIYVNYYWNTPHIEPYQLFFFAKEEFCLNTSDMGLEFSMIRTGKYKRHSAYLISKINPKVFNKIISLYELKVAQGVFLPVNKLPKQEHLCFI